MRGARLRIGLRQKSAQLEERRRVRRRGGRGEGKKFVAPTESDVAHAAPAMYVVFFLPPFPFPSSPLSSVRPLPPSCPPPPPLLFLLERASDPFVCRSKCMYVCVCVCTCERARAYRTFVCTQISVKHAPYICIYPILARVSSLSCIVSSVFPDRQFGEAGKRAFPER